MASKSLSGLHDPYDSANQAYGQEPLAAPKWAYHNPPAELDQVLDYYFGEPTSTHKSDPRTPRWSKW